MESKTKAVLHGECLIFESKVPDGAVKEKVEGNFVIIANSETTGNHHLIDVEQGVDFYTLDGVRYLRNSKPANVRCVLKERHDEIKLPPGEWQIGYQTEFNYYEMAKRNVRD